MSELKPKDKAPNFKLKNQKAEWVSLKDFKGKKLALFFYPKDDTPGCTKQACNLSDNYKALKKAGIEVVGVSPDSIESHKDFEKKYKLPFTLLADEKKKTINDYGVWGEKNLYGNKFMGLKRTTFLINEDGSIEKIIKGVRTAKHSEQILKAWSM